MQKRKRPIPGYNVIDDKGDTCRFGFSVADNQEREGLPPAGGEQYETLPGYEQEEIYPDEPHIPLSSPPPSQNHRNDDAVPECEMDEVFPEPPQYPPIHQNHYPRRFSPRPRRQIPEDLQDMILFGVALFFIWIALLIFT